MAKVTIVFEVDDKYKTTTDLTTAADTLHEDLCLAIHEFDPEAIKCLNAYITNIIHPQFQ